MSYEFTDKVLAIRLPSTQKLVLLCLACHANNKGECWPGRSLLSEETGLSAKSISTAVKELQAAGYLTIKKRQGNKNGYIISSEPPSLPKGNVLPHSSEPPSLPKGNVLPHSSEPPSQPILNRSENQPDEPVKEPISAGADDGIKKAEEKSSEKPKPSHRPRDELFDTITEICHLDPKVHGSSIGKAKQKLQKFNPPPTPQELRLFAEIYAKQHPVKQFPRWWDLVDGFGIVRNQAAVQAILKGRKVAANQHNIIKHDPETPKLPPNHTSKTGDVPF